MLAGVLVAAISIVGFGKQAYAHFIVEDTNTGLKALFHVTPDHDPIAGEESIISYDFAKTGFESKEYSYSLAVKPTKGEAVAVPLDIVGNVILATYTFPSRGFYDIVLTATAKKDGAVSKIQYGQRVSRGAAVERNEGLGPIAMAAIGGTVLLAVGVVIFSLKSDHNKRKGKRNEV